MGDTSDVVKDWENNIDKRTQALMQTLGPGAQVTRSGPPDEYALHASIRYPNGEAATLRETMSSVLATADIKKGLQTEQGFVSGKKAQNGNFIIPSSSSGETPADKRAREHLQKYLSLTGRSMKTSFDATKKSAPAAVA